MTKTPQLSIIKHSLGWRVASASTPGAGIVKLTFPLVPLLACMAYSPHENATTNHAV
jgi:hypothetical protein